SDSMTALVSLRCVQGLGGGLLLSASLPLLARRVRSGDVVLNTWSTAAAIGMAVGPAAGGILTQIFDWRSIFLAQAPVAALAAILVLVVHIRATPTVDTKRVRPAELAVLTANAGLTLISAGLISALFLVVILLINVWRLTPIEAAAVVTSIPLATAVAERAVRGRPPFILAAVGATLVALGLTGASLLTHREVAWVAVTLAMVGAGIGFAFPSLTTVALGGLGPAAARAAKTVAARDGGIVLGLLVLTPVFVHQLNQAPTQALATATTAVLTAPISPRVEASLVPGLLADYRRTPQGELPDFGHTFSRASLHATDAERVAFGRLHRQLDSIVERAVTSAFKLPLRYGAIFALAVLPLLALDLISKRWTRPRPLRAASHPRT
ncbi:MAG: MFS transporter, partial [Solirubrobacteraceae bacterium]